VHTETRLVGADVAARTFCVVLCRVLGGPVIVFGRRGVGYEWYESSLYSNDGRPEARRFEEGTLKPKAQTVRISKLVSLIQPAVVQESVVDITRISDLVGEHTAEQRIRTDGELLTCVLVRHECITTVALYSVVSYTTSIARLPKSSWRHPGHSPDLGRIQHEEAYPLQGPLPAGRQRRIADPLGRPTLRHRGLPDQAYSGPCCLEGLSRTSTGKSPR
jgi:hypothetical protein